MFAGCSGNNNQPANVSGKGSSSNSNSNSGSSKAPVPAPNTPPDNVRRVTISELRDMLEQGKAVVVDVRGSDTYQQEHIKGALDIPESQLTARMGELPKDKLIVFYCS
jgi:3-mercaptopyruvate sulfurtransferase SseA